ncbi:MAG: hypothetical protein A4E53_01548 [Pelotomaculum sp. PtaB.Bin104]|nr:MAG: hypothetical protein A4E53_01548 [Pelotomaculum sp. PtaB.Bin104]
MQKLSPFSPLNNYKVFYTYKSLYNLVEPTPQEIVLLNMLKDCGVMAGFQIESILCSRKKLKSLANQKVIAKFKLEGTENRINVYSLEPEIDLELAFKRLAFAQLYVRIRRITPCEAALCPAPLTGMIWFNGASYPVLVLRKGESTVLLPDILKSLPRVLVVSEDLIKLNLGIPFRMTTDRDLLDKPLRYAFYNEIGQPEEAVQFPEEKSIETIL